MTTEGIARARFETPPQIFVPGGDESLGARVALHLGVAPAALEERRFEDGERKIRPLENVRDRDVYVVESLAGDPTDSVHDKLVRVLMLLGALRDAGAGRLTALLPYLCYARKDARTKSRDPVATRSVALLLESVGLDRVVTVEVHNVAAYENAFRLETVHLETSGLFAAHFAGRLDPAREVTVLSPDFGGAKRAKRFRTSLEAALGRTVDAGYVEKFRDSGSVSGSALVGPVRGRAVIVIDDLISTGGTLVRAVSAAREGGAADVYAVATHGLFADRAPEVLETAGLSGLVVTDTLPPRPPVVDRLGSRLVVLDTAPLLADAIGRLARGEALPDED